MPNVLALFLLALFTVTPAAAGEFTHKDGPFAGDMFVIDPAGLEEFKKPSDQGVSLKGMDKVKVGQKFAVVFVFHGMELRSDKSCDVTYDLKILDPNGKLEGPDTKEQLGLKEKITDQNLVFNNRAIPIVAFDDKSVMGKYKLVGTLHDKVGNKHIPLTAEFELVK